MTHTYHPDAAKELPEAVRYYEDSRDGLGGEFLDDIEIAIEAIKEHPARWPKLGRDVRRDRQGAVRSAS